MSQEIRETAERRMDEAIESGARDPREHYRTLMRALKEKSPEAYREAVRHYQEELVPAVAEEMAEPVAAWRDFGRMLAELTTPGRAVTVDVTGAARPYDPSDDAGGPGDELVLHLPEEGRRRALLVALPPEPSDAQRATCRLLVNGRQTI